MGLSRGQGFLCVNDGAFLFHKGHVTARCHRPGGFLSVRMDPMYIPTPRSPLGPCRPTGIALKSGRGCCAPFWNKSFYFAIKGPNYQQIYFVQHRAFPKANDEGRKASWSKRKPHAKLAHDQRGEEREIGIFRCKPSANASLSLPPVAVLPFNTWTRYVQLHLYTQRIAQ